MPERDNDVRVKMPCLYMYETLRLGASSQKQRPSFVV